MTAFDKATGDIKRVGAEGVHLPHIFAGPVISVVLVLLFVILMVTDYSNILLSEKRNRAAQDLVKPGMRLTQAERMLNGAGYMTLYIEASPPMLQVSTLSRFPMTAELLHNVIPNSAPDIWLRSKLSGKTRFYLAGEEDGSIQFLANGRPVIYSRDLGDAVATNLELKF